MSIQAFRFSCSANKAIPQSFLKYVRHLIERYIAYNNEQEALQGSAQGYLCQDQVNALQKQDFEAAKREW